ncbi:MAG: hypothetical protein DWQ07_09920 [Chloroflexi bacterium]|nr:MAG: hypothetical protein DWQ07_09920 [Chloroflexota bacterium]MBL1192970.1 hypothetical protein [Chloroflexota bacterium]NOH10262.1 hypothetical protein [Chloroflexota bacterium]
MPYTVEVTKTFNYPYIDVYKSLYLSVEAMKGKILVHDPDNQRFEAQMDKKLYGKYLGDRSRLEISFDTESEEQTALLITAYPVNPIGQKLMFGARKGVIPRVLEALQTEMESRLEKE